MYGNKTLNSYLRTFGLVKIKNAVDDISEIEQIYTDVVRKLSKGRPPVVAGVERDTRLTEALLSKGIIKFADLVFGQDQWLYWGSDLSEFSGGSNWHRDAFQDIPSWKIAIYLSGSYGEDQTFLYIPGSHHVNDGFSRQLSDSLNWPVGTGLKSEYFSAVIDIEGRTIETNVPCAAAKINEGDILVFDTRLIHAVLSQSYRRMIALSFVPSEKSAGYFCYGAYQSPDDYSKSLLKLRCASKVLETLHGREVIYGQKDLPATRTELGKYMPFIQFDDEELCQLCDKFFQGDKKTEALSVINKT